MFWVYKTVDVAVQCETTNQTIIFPQNALIVENPSLFILKRSQDQHNTAGSTRTAWFVSPSQHRAIQVAYMIVVLS